MVRRQRIPLSYGSNNGFLCTNILENQAQWRDKTKGLGNLVTVDNVRVIRTRRGGLPPRETLGRTIGSIVTSED